MAERLAEVQRKWEAKLAPRQTMLPSGPLRSQGKKFATGAESRLRGSFERSRRAAKRPPAGGLVSTTQASEVFRRTTSRAKSQKGA